MPEREDEHLTPATKLLEKRREMQEVENALAVEKEVNFKYPPRKINFLNNYESSNLKNIFIGISNEN